MRIQSFEKCLSGGKMYVFVELFEFVIAYFLFSLVLIGVYIYIDIFVAYMHV